MVGLLQPIHRSMKDIEQLQNIMELLKIIFIALKNVKQVVFYIKLEVILLKEMINTIILVNMPNSKNMFYIETTTNVNIVEK